MLALVIIALSNGHRHRRRRLGMSLPRAKRRFNDVVVVYDVIHGAEYEFL